VLDHIRFALFALPAVLFAQNQPQFEVASIKPFIPSPVAGRGGGGCPPFRMDRDRVDICGTLATIIGYAYRLPKERIVGPDWLTTRRAEEFAVAAKLPEDTTASQVPEMLQALLADRFQLAVHRGSREQLITALVVAKGGPKLQEATAGDDDPAAINNPTIGPVCTTESAGPTFHWEASSITMAGLAELCSGVGFVPPVVDMAGLKGRYQLDLTVTLKESFAAAQQARDDPAAGDIARADMREAMLRAFNDSLQKLGLQLERRKGTVETLVIDHVEKTPTGN
jgi:uncharacterized protein (TIGR03435 family)